jgi:hypothetical protein
MDKDGNCLICEGHCPWYKHRNLPYILRVRPTRIKKDDTDLKEKYGDAVNRKQTTETMIKKLATDLMDIEREVSANIQQIRVCLQELDSIAMRPSKVTDVHYIEKMISQEKLTMESGWEERITILENQLSMAKLIEQTRDPNFDPHARYREHGTSWRTFLADRFKKYRAWIQKTINAMSAEH